MAYDIIRPKDRDGWLQERKKGLGSSDAGTIMGVSPFSSPLKLWRQKMGIDPPFEESEAMRNGHFLEAAVAEYFASVTSSTIDRTSEGDWLAADHDRPWRRVSPDRLFWPEGVEQVPQNWLILEIKSTSKFVDPDNLPLYWLCQVQYQMGVMGIGLAAIAWVTSEPRLSMGHAFVKFNPAFFDTLIGAVDNFWNENILKNVTPVPVTEDDAALMWPTSRDHATVQATEEDIEACREYLEKSKERDELDKRISELAARIKIRLGDAEQLQATEEGTGKVLVLAKYKSINETVFDDNALRNEHPDVYAQYTKAVFDQATFRDEAKDLFAKYSSKKKGARRFSVNKKP